MSHILLIMVGKKQIELVEHVSVNRLDEEIKKCDFYRKLWTRLIFIRMLTKSEDLIETADNIGISVPTAYTWLKRYNKDGLDGLVPNYGGGRPSFLTEEDKVNLTKILDEKIENNEALSMKDIHKIILDEFDVDYSLKQVGVIIKKLGYAYSKAYPFLLKTTR